MTSKSIVLALGIALFVVTGAAAATCDLQMTLTCESSGRCTTRTTNTGTSVCSGTFYSGFLGGTSFSGMTTSLGLSQCFSAGVSDPGSSPNVCIGDASLAPGSSFTAAISVAGKRVVLASDHGYNGSHQYEHR